MYLTSHELMICNSYNFGSLAIVFNVLESPEIEIESLNLLGASFFFSLPMLFCGMLSLTLGLGKSSITVIDIGLKI